MAQVGARVMQQRRLRSELRRIREGAGRTQKWAAEALGWSMSKVIRIETGVVPVSPADVMAMLHVYELDDRRLADELVAITRTRTAMWWDEYRDILSDQALDLLDYENSATGIRQYIGFAMPGLLQTDEYAMAAAGRLAGPDTVERLVEVQQRRQHRLSESDGPQASFVLDEAVLHRRVGGPSVMRNQLLHLKEVANAGDVTILVVPFTSGTHLGMAASFTIFEFAPEYGDSIVTITDPHREAVIRDDPESAKKYAGTFRELQDLATDRLDEIIDPLLETMRRAS
ncbi:MAG TPA: helix-turn-helix transcriptional regulator [Actinophytocola sp.]|jgi:transcriptional regulator with XRE-family HTH domain|uniref:helix-turn-helix domain-containing protein n=1 Tax=Actinophytocola sp. TaxID=1872138 RepID=UPI002F928329